MLSFNFLNTVNVGVCMNVGQKIGVNVDNAFGINGVRDAACIIAGGFCGFIKGSSKGSDNTPFHIECSDPNGRKITCEISYYEQEIVKISSAVARQGFPTLKITLFGYTPIKIEKFQKKLIKKNFQIQQIVDLGDKVILKVTTKSAEAEKGLKIQEAISDLQQRYKTKDLPSKFSYQLDGKKSIECRLETKSQPHKMDTELLASMDPRLLASYPGESTIIISLSGFSEEEVQVFKNNLDSQGLSRSFLIKDA